MILVACAVGLVEVVLGTVLGAAIYKEGAISSAAAGGR
jgi:hypothetical protein